MNIKETLLAVGIGLALLTTGAHADHLKPWRTADSVLIPPKQYDPRYVGKPVNTRILKVPHKDLQATCNRINGVYKFGPGVDECAFWKINTMVLPSDAPDALRAALARHGYGHILAKVPGHEGWY